LEILSIHYECKIFFDVSDKGCRARIVSHLKIRETNVPSFLCYYLNEITLLCDGRATTCCMDPLGINNFADIGDGYWTVQEQYLAIREKVSRDIESMPRCKICYEKIKAAGFPNTGTYVVDPSPLELERFLKNGPEALENSWSS
jgi:hypothetical protein